MKWRWRRQRKEKNRRVRLQNEVQFERRFKMMAMKKYLGAKLMVRVSVQTFSHTMPLYSRLRVTLFKLFSL